VVSVRVVVDEPEVVLVLTVPKATADLAARQVSSVLALDVPDWLRVEGVDVTARFSDREEPNLV
ncbi:MAG TPA: hypothetical protein VJ553_06790, partial [Candidatus Paceibacterota bacterium]|nr:hypothetical protein [Candidatus Paceibacterota bacterium]